MTDPRWLNDLEARAWRRYNDMSTQLAAELHRRLLRETGLSLSDYVVLVHLSEAPEDRMRAFELGAALQWEKSRLSHHITRMEARGLVEKRTCESDARGLFVMLTTDGRRAIEEAAPHHVEHVRRLLIDHLTEGQLETLAEISEKVLAEIPSPNTSCD